MTACWYFKSALPASPSRCRRDADVAFMRDAQCRSDMSASGRGHERCLEDEARAGGHRHGRTSAFDQRVLRGDGQAHRASVTEVKASHAVFMTQPKAVADVIEQAARNAVRAARKS